MSISLSCVEGTGLQAGMGRGAVGLREARGGWCQVSHKEMAGVGAGWQDFRSILSIHRSFCSPVP